jgi:methylated-DNA-[protein]-cysteine S-methyltransferase
MLERHHARLKTPFAVLGIRTVGARVTDIEYLPVGAAALAPLNALAEQTCAEIERYLDDPEYPMQVPFELAGTPFQCRVWTAIAAIRPGRTRTYTDLARTLKTAPRPVGGACGANRLPLVIPCHRVVATGGIGGFMNARSGSPLDVKRWLLRHEGSALA